MQHIGFALMAHEVETIIMKARADYKNVFSTGI